MINCFFRKQKNGSFGFIGSLKRFGPLAEDIKIVAPGLFSHVMAGDIIYKKGISGDNELTIINRWGKVIYHTQHYQNTWQAIDQPEGTYFYYLKLTGYEGKKGWVVVVR